MPARHNSLSVAASVRNLLTRANQCKRCIACQLRRSGTPLQTSLLSSIHDTDGTDARDACKSTLNTIHLPTESNWITKDSQEMEQFLMSLNSLTPVLWDAASLLTYVLKPVLLSSMKVLVLEDPRGPIFKSSSLSSSSEVQVLENFRGLSRLTWHAKYQAPSSCSDRVMNGWLICHCAPVRLKFMSIWPYCLTAVVLSSRTNFQVLVLAAWLLVLPCPRPWVSSPCQQHCLKGARVPLYVKIYDAYRRTRSSTVKKQQKTEQTRMQAIAN